PAARTYDVDRPALIIGIAEKARIEMRPYGDTRRSLRESRIPQEQALRYPYTSGLVRWDAQEAHGFSRSDHFTSRRKERVTSGRDASNSGRAAMNRAPASRS